MSTLTTVEEVRAYLLEVPAEAHIRLEELVSEAQSIQDIDRIQLLAEAVEPLASDNLYLQQWHTYMLGYLASVSQRPEKAISYLESLRTQVDSLAPNLQGRVFNGLGIVYEMNEQPDRAMRCYQQYIEIAKKGENKLDLGKAYSNLAILHCKAMMYQTALSSIERSIGYLSQQEDDQQWQIPLGGAWNEIGVTYLKLGQLTEAHHAFEQYLTISKRWGFLQGLGIGYCNLANVYRQWAELEKASEYYTQARNISFQVGDLFVAAEAIYGLGLVTLEQPNALNEAKVVFNEALNVSHIANNHEIITQIFLRKADIEERLGNKAAAREETRRAVQSVESLRANIALPEARIRLQGSRIEAYEQMVRRLIQDQTGYAEAFSFAEMAKSRGMIEMLSTRPVRPPANVSPEWLKEEAQLRQDLRVAYEDLDGGLDQIAIKEAELAQIRELIRQQAPEFDSLYTAMPLSLDRVMAQLPPDTVLLEYFSFDDTILSFVITSNKISITQLAVSLERLKRRAFTKTEDGEFYQLRNLTLDPDGLLRPPWILEELSKILLGPLDEIVWAASTLYIVPHNFLHYIPFHALYRQTEGGPQYLCGDVSNPRQIVYAPSATTLFEYCQSKPSSNQADCLAVGYNGVSLSEAEIEAQAVVDIVGGDCLTEGAATSASLFKLGRNYRYLHISCHGSFNPTWPMASNLSLADGPLDVSDILQNLYLDSDLVSLSACETGLSHILDGDELIGLVRAFLYAGTPSVLVSQWLVNDLSTRLLMEEFYTALAKSIVDPRPVSKAKLLANAQYYIRNLTYDDLHQLLQCRTEIEHADIPEILKNLARAAGDEFAIDNPAHNRPFWHPYYWASFFLIGDRIL